MDQIFFIVEMLRNNDREHHSYTIGIFDNEFLALKEAWEHMKLRAGKYGAEVSGYKLNSGKRVYYHQLDSWDAFAASCKETAEKLKDLIKEEE